MTSSKIEEITARRLPPNAGKGRPKGSQNHVTGSMKEMILTAFEMAGGADWLAGQAEKNPVAFMGLLGKLLPSDIALSGQVAMGQITEIRRTIVDPPRRALDGSVIESDEQSIEH